VCAHTDLFVCVYIFTYIGVNTCVCTYRPVCVRVYIYICRSKYMCVHTDLCVRVYMFTYVGVNTFECMPRCVRMNASVST